MASAEYVHAWITDPADQAYIDVRAVRLAELDAERKRLLRQIHQRQQRAWDDGGRERYLTATAHIDGNDDA